MPSLIAWTLSNKRITAIIGLIAIILAQLVYANHLSGKIAAKDRYHAAYVEAHKAQVFDATVKSIETERTWQTQKSVAEGKANEAEQNAVAWRNRANSTFNSLQQTISTARNNMPTNTDSAVVEYAATFEAIFAECSREYAEVAQAADGHAIDAAKISDAWPKNDILNRSQ